VSGSFVIDALPEQGLRYRHDHDIVAIDVFRATTTIVTAIDRGRRVYPVVDEPEARQLARRLPGAVMAGELAGKRPDGFAFNNSPATIAAATDQRPLILVSSAGTKLLANSRGAAAVYIACFRNLSAVSRHLARSPRPIALIGAGARGQPRPEDSMACARIGRFLMTNGFTPEDARSAEQVARWAELEVETVGNGASADFLRATGQEEDIDFVVGHVDDVDLVVIYDGLEARTSGVAQEAMGS
jgi:2-phosphosulfolactate phosphatase